MVTLLDDPGDKWVKDTLKWWNRQVIWISVVLLLYYRHSSHIFGTLYSTSDDEQQEQEPTTTDLLQVKREARKKATMIKILLIFMFHSCFEQLLMKSYSSGASSASQVPPSHHQSTPQHHHQNERDTSRRPEKSHHDSTHANDSTDYPSPLQPYNSNVPQHYCDHHSSPAPHNQEWSRSLPHQARTTLNTGPQTMHSHMTGPSHHHNSPPASPCHRHHWAPCASSLSSTFPLSSSLLDCSCLHSALFLISLSVVFPTHYY